MSRKRQSSLSPTQPQKNKALVKRARDGSQENKALVKRARDGSQSIIDQANHNQIKYLEDKISKIKKDKENSKRFIRNNKKYIRDKYKNEQFLRQGTKYNDLNTIIGYIRADTDLKDKKSEWNKKQEKQMFFSDNSESESSYESLGEEIIKIEAEYESLLEKKIEEEIKKILDGYDQKIQEKRKEIEDKDKELFDKTRVVWTAPSTVIDTTENTEIDHFIYSGKNPSKTVKIPFREIHQELIKNSYLLRNGEPVKNILIGSFVFIISEGVHPGYNNPDCRYMGGRTFIKIPIKHYPSEEEKAKSYRQSNKSSSHSEVSLAELLEEDVFITGLVKNIKSAIKTKLNIEEINNIKIYQNILFLNSYLSACFNCSKLLYKLQRGNENSFLKKLQSALLDEGFVLSRKHEEKLEPYSEDLDPYSAPSSSPIPIEGELCEGNISSSEVETKKEKSGNSTDITDLKKHKRLRAQVSYSANKVNTYNDYNKLHDKEAAAVFNSEEIDISDISEESDISDIPEESTLKERFIDTNTLSAKAIIETPDFAICDTKTLFENIKNQVTQVTQDEKKALEELTPSNTAFLSIGISYKSKSSDDPTTNPKIFRGFIPERLKSASNQIQQEG